MKKTIITLYFSLALFGCGGGGSDTASPNGQGVNTGSATFAEAVDAAFSDPYLAECVNYYSDLWASLPAGTSDIDAWVRENLTTIECSDTSSSYSTSYAGNLTSLSGIEAFTNMTRINVANNQITNVQPLYSLPVLNYLDISGNNVSCTDIINLRSYVASIGGTMVDDC